MKATKPKPRYQSEILTEKYGHYTDPILFEEGFFKDREDERKYMEKVHRAFEKMANEKARTPKRKK